MPARSSDHAASCRSTNSYERMARLLQAISRTRLVPWSPEGKRPAICRVVGPLGCHLHLPDLIKEAPKFWPRNEAHGSVRVQDGQPIRLPDSSSGRARAHDPPLRAARSARHTFSEVAGASI